MPSTQRTAAAVAGGTALALAGARALRSPTVRFARMPGWSIAAPDAAGWITDFLNAAYYRRPTELARLEDLRLAFAIVTTRWHRGGHRRLHAHDVVAFHRAFGRDRFLDGSRTARGTLDGEQLVEGAARMFGDWFPEAYDDHARRGWGIVFATAEEGRAYEPEVRLRHASLGAMTPPAKPFQEQTWHTYDPVEVPSAEAALAALLAVERWPDFATEIGRFTPLRSKGLKGQTFEIEVAAGTELGLPVFTRGYVTVTRLVTTEDPAGLEEYLADLDRGLARYGDDEPPALPPGATPIAAFDLTTHEGHFMGSGLNRLLLFEHDGKAMLRAAGTWDPMPWAQERAYQRAGRDAQHAFWGEGADARRSMLHQIALACREPHA